MKNTSGLMIRMAMLVLFICSLVSSVNAAPLPHIKIFSDTGAVLNTNYLRLNEVKGRAARDFFSRFSAVDDEKWLGSEEGFCVKFTSNEVLTHVYYDRGGYFINTIRYYKESSIPARLKKTIVRAFGGYTILSATEVITEKETSFHFNISDPERMKTVRICREVIEVTGDYRNAALDLE